MNQFVIDINLGEGNSEYENNLHRICNKSVMSPLVIVLLSTIGGVCYANSYARTDHLSIGKEGGEEEYENHS